MRVTEGVVYAATCGDDDEREMSLIKIGASSKPETRFTDSSYDIVYSRPDVLVERDGMWFGKLENRILGFLSLHGLRYEDNDPDDSPNGDWRAIGSTELMKFDEEAVELLEGALDFADHDVREFLLGLLDLRDQGVLP